jgi:2Fe-2S ferredoxin
MPKVTYIEFDGTQHTVEARVGDTLMSAAVRNLVPGIEADCGGGCSCGTCHVFVDPAWHAQIGPPDAMEEPMLDLNPARNERSRLSCQIDITESVDGLVVALPEHQY